MKNKLKAPRFQKSMLREGIDLTAFPLTGLMLLNIGHLDEHPVLCEQFQDYTAVSVVRVCAAPRTASFLFRISKFDGSNLLFGFCFTVVAVVV